MAGRTHAPAPKSTHRTSDSTPEVLLPKLPSSSRFLSASSILVFVFDSRLLLSPARTVITSSHKRGARPCRGPLLWRAKSVSVSVFVHTPWPRTRGWQTAYRPIHALCPYMQLNATSQSPTLPATNGIGGVRPISHRGGKTAQMLQTFARSFAESLSDGVRCEVV